MTVLRLDSPIERIDLRMANRRVGTRRAGAPAPPAHAVLADGLGIETVGQLLRLYPRRYIDRSDTQPIRSLRIGQDVTVIARVKRLVKRLTRRRQSMITITIADGTGYLDLLFFNQPWLERQYKEGVELAVSGRVGLYRGRLQLQNQEVEVLRGDEVETIHTGRITPVHPAADGITSRTIRELVHRALQQLGPIPDPLPAALVEGESLSSEDRALRAIHFPEDPQDLALARDRLKFDELFILELGVAFRKHRVESTEQGVAHRSDGPLGEALLGSLPFEPTAAQRRAMKEIAEDMAAPHPMHRLLQGDVGSGKTVVALHAALTAIGSGHQSAVMAPTEVLAGQHHRNLAGLLEPLGGQDLLAVPEPGNAKASPDQERLFTASPDQEGTGGQGPTYAMLTASVTGRDRRRVLDGLRDGAVDLVIGTHALVQEGVELKDLSLAVIDEQHRFGVHQRVLLK
ncbi:MAG TPA: DEAD/DEAH box helicase, partial [Actinomycetota bacterium]